MQCQTTSGGGTGILSRFPVKIGSGNPTKLRLVFNNAWLTTGGETLIANDVLIDEVALERVTGTTAAPVTFSGGRTATLLAGAVDFLSDDILPSAFGLSEFTKGDDYYIKVKAHVASSGQYFPGSRSIQEGLTQRSKRYNYGAGTVSAAETYGDFTSVSGTPAITNEGTGGNSNGFCPMVVGYFANGDTKTFFVNGDSIIDGTASPYDGTFMQYACNTASGGPYAMMEVAAGGSSQVDFNGASTLYRTLYKYARILVDELGTNAPTTAITTHFPAIWNAARAAGIKRVWKTRLLPRTYSSLTVTSITQSGTTATLTPATGTLPPVGASIIVISSTPANYNGTFTVTRSGGGSFDYTMGSAPGADCSNPGTVRWSDQWTTEANQQYSGAGGSGGSNDNFDSQMITYRNSGVLDGILALAAAHGTDQFKWPAATPGLPNDTWNNAFSTGTHPKTTTSQTIAAEVAPLLDSMVV